MTEQKIMSSQMFIATGVGKKKRNSYSPFFHIIYTCQIELNILEAFYDNMGMGIHIVTVVPHIYDTHRNGIVLRTAAYKCKIRGEFLLNFI